ncbi:hypothetical protein V6Z05_18050 [Leptospira venezuelensis]|uniref:hypothetical protein n=1 Tax=Leptospira venezuelensis TaxID=1958811 RepID=UPI000A398A15|nr:hypothetical protein [Leptospira venezuelensis]
MQKGYLFGAGISVNSIPLAQNLPERIIRLAEVLRIKYKFSDSGSDSNIEELKEADTDSLFESMLEEWKEIGRNSKGVTVDTYAKENKTNPPVLNKIKRVISSYLIVEQSVDSNLGLDEYNSNLDNRIRKFVTDLVVERVPIKLIDDPIIFSWNYDIQFEIALANHFKSSIPDSVLLAYVQNQLNVTPRRNLHDSESSPNSHRIYKLNGTAGFYEDKSPFKNWISFSDVILQEDFGEKLRAVVYGYHSMKIRHQEVSSTLFFGFESNNTVRGLDDEIISDAGRIEHLTIMGYSFPIMNEKIDEKILGSMKSLKVVRIIDLPSRKEDMISLFKRRSGKMIEPEFSSNYEVIPIEEKFNT